MNTDNPQSFQSGSLSWTCHNCGAVNKGEYMVCPNCGHFRLREGEAAPTPTVQHNPAPEPQMPPLYQSAYTQESPTFSPSAPVYEPAPAKRKKWPIFVAIGGGVSVLFVIIFMLIIIGAVSGDSDSSPDTPEEIYTEANDAYDSGNYKKALRLFNDLPEGYEDSANMIQKSKYYYACEILEEDGNYTDAREYFTELGDYEDSAEKLKECTYKEATALSENGDYEGAMKLFDEISSYSDASEKKKECSYNIGLKQLEDGEYEDALTSFKDASDYSDAENKIKECNYNIASDYESAGDYVEAMKMFSDLGTYSDSSSRFTTAENSLISANKSHGKFKGPENMIGRWANISITVEYSENDDGSYHLSYNMPADSGAYFELTDGVHQHGDDTNAMKKQWIYQDNSTDSSTSVKVYNYTNNTTYILTKYTD